MLFFLYCLLFHRCCSTCKQTVQVEQQRYNNKQFKQNNNDKQQTAQAQQHIYNDAVVPFKTFKIYNSQVRGRPFNFVGGAGLGS
jgi:hypothetical protein